MDNWFGTGLGSAEHQKSVSTEFRDIVNLKGCLRAPMSREEGIELVKELAVKRLSPEEWMAINTTLSNLPPEKPLKAIWRFLKKRVLPFLES